MKRFIALTAAAAALTTTIAAGSAQAITNDYETDDTHDFVGLMVALDDQGEFMWRCSGSLLDDQVTFLTAGHCTDQNFVELDGNGEPHTFSVASVRIYFDTFAGTAYDADLGLDPVTGYPDACNPGIICVESDQVFDFGFDNFAEFPNTHDAGVVILDEPLQLDSYGTLADAGTLDDLATARGTKDLTFEASGFGLSYSSPVGVESFRTRLHGYGTLVNLRSNNTDGYNLQTNGNGKGKGGTCSGDSGGPIFYPADSNQIVAVTSFGLNAYCRGVDFSYRVDRSDVLDWIAAPTNG